MTTYLLVPGAGGDGRFWDRLVASLAVRGHHGVAVTLPGPDDSAGLAAYADVIVDAGRDLGPLVLVAQSMGGFSAPLAVDRLDVERVVLINAMVPAPGETAGEWGGAVGQAEPSEDFDVQRVFFHDVPEEVTRELFSRPAPDESERAFTDAWPLDAWPDVPTSGIAGADDRLFSADLQLRVARDRLGIELDVLPGGHLVALANPDLVADWLIRS